MADTAQFSTSSHIKTTVDKMTQHDHNTNSRRVLTLLALPYEIHQSILTYAISQERTIHIHKPMVHNRKSIKHGLTHSIRSRHFYHQALLQSIYAVTVRNNTEHLWSDDLQMCFHRLWTQPATEGQRLSCPYRLHIDILYTCRHFFTEGRHLLWSTNTYHFDDPTVLANVLSRKGMEAAAMRAMSISLDWRHFYIRSKENQWGTKLT